MSDEGLTAWQLLYKLWGGKFPDEKQAKRFMMPHEEYEERILRRAYSVLGNDVYYAMGYPFGSEKRAKIPSDYWSFLHIHPPTNIAAGAGHEYHSLRFFKVLTQESREEAYLRDLKELMKTEKRQGREDCKTDALGRGLTEDAFDRCWREAKKAPTTHPSWKKRGPWKR